MKLPEPVIISDRESLIEKIKVSSKGASLWVEWKVLPPFGPDWIKGGRYICFYLNQNPLADNAFHQQLKIALIQALNILAESPTDIINGEEDIKLTALTIGFVFCTL